MSRFGLGFAGAPFVLTNTGSGTAPLSGTEANGNLLTADFLNNDPDGAATGITYQWFRDVSTTIVGATSSTYLLTSTDVGHTVRCRVNYTDGKGFSESIFTASSGTIGTGAMSNFTLRGDTSINNQSSGTFTVSSAAIGTAAADRWVFVLFFSKNATARTLNSVTIGGVTAAVETISGTHNQTLGLVGIAFAKVPTGTTANIVFTWSGGFTASTSNGMGFTWYTVNGDLNTTFNDGFNSNLTTNPSYTHNVKKNGGFCIVGSVPNNVGHNATGDLTVDRAFVQYVAAVLAWSASATNATGADANKVWATTAWANGGAALPSIGRAYGSL